MVPINYVGLEMSNLNTFYISKHFCTVNYTNEDLLNVFIVYGQYKKVLTRTFDALTAQYLQKQKPPPNIFKKNIETHKEHIEGSRLLTMIRNEFLLKNYIKRYCSIKCLFFVTKQIKIKLSGEPFKITSFEFKTFNTP